MKALLQTLPIAGLVAVATTLSGQAQTISGSIQFSGGSTNDTTSLLTSSKMLGFTGTGLAATPVVQYGDSGSYFGVPSGQPVAFNSFDFSLGVGPIPSTTLWSFTYGGDVYSFAANAITTLSQRSLILAGGAGEEDFLNIKGTGIASILGSNLNPTPGTFSITESGPPGATTAFNFSEIIVVPEPSTLALLAISAIPLAWPFVRRGSLR